MATWRIEKIYSTGFTSSALADDYTNKLRFNLGFEAKAPIVRMSIGRSLREPDPVSKCPDHRGKVIRGETIFGDMCDLWIALLASDRSQAYPGKDITMSDIQDAVSRHWHRGVELLMADWNEAGDYSKFIDIIISRRTDLPDELPLPSINMSRGRAEDIADAESIPQTVQVELGSDLENYEPIEWIVNGVGYSPHIAIMGQAGSGKTRAMTKIIQEINSQTSSPVLLLDLGKGELANDDSLIASIKANVLRVPENAIPLDMFYGSCESDSITSDTVMGFRDSFEKVSKSSLGARQLDNLREALKPMFSKEKNISLEKICTCLEKFYEQESLQTDSIISTIKDLTERTIFKPEMPPDEFFSKSWIIVFNHARDTVKNLAAYMILDSLNAYMKLLNDSSQDASGHRAIRMILAIDEARHILASRHQALSDNIRLHRSKGLVVTLASQSPDDYDGAGDDYLENIGLPICFKTNARSTVALRNMFGRAVNFAGLDTGVCMTVKEGRAIKVKSF